MHEQAEAPPPPLIDPHVNVVTQDSSPLTATRGAFPKRSVPSHLRGRRGRRVRPGGRTGGRTVAASPDSRRTRTSPVRGVTGSEGTTGVDDHGADDDGGLSLRDPSLLVMGTHVDGTRGGEDSPSPPQPAASDAGDRRVRRRRPRRGRSPEPDVGRHGRNGARLGAGSRRPLSGERLRSDVDGVEDGDRWDIGSEAGGSYSGYSDPADRSHSRHYHAHLADWEGDFDGSGASHGAGDADHWLEAAEQRRLDRLGPRRPAPARDRREDGSGSASLSPVPRSGRRRNDPERKRLPPPRLLDVASRSGSSGTLLAGGNQRGGAISPKPASLAAGMAEVEQVDDPVLRERLSRLRSTSINKAKYSFDQV